MAPFLGGCEVGPDFRVPRLFSPASWFSSRPPPSAALASLPVAEPVDPNWWSVFRDPILTRLVADVAASNLDVRTATIRLAESRSQRRITSADEFPQVNGNTSYTREKQSRRGVLGLLGGGGGGASGSGDEGGTSATPGTSSNGLGGRQTGIPTSAAGSASSSIAAPFNLWQYGFDSSWELDLFGRIRRAVEAADANVDASGDTRRSTLISSIAEVARDYVQLRGVQDQLRVTRENLAASQNLLSLTQSRQRAGLTTGLDVANAAAQVASTAAQIPGLEQQEDQGINQLSFLLGRTPGALAATLKTPRPVPPVPPRVPIGLPSELARRRPDIRQAEAELHSATAEIGAAQADFYPRITLSGSLALQALQFKNLGNWDSRTYSFGPAIVLPIFQGGRLRATLELRRQQQQEAAVNYQKTVLQAFHDVDNALIAYTAEQRRTRQLADAVTQSREALRLAEERYRAGLSDFLNVLTAQRTLLQAQLQQSDSAATLATDLVQLYKALGGGWEQSYPADEAKARSTRT